MYNLLHKATVTSSGSVNLTDNEIDLLRNYNTTSSGIVLSNLDTLDLYVDLNDRYYVNSLILYATNTSGIDIYYKESTNDAYTGPIISNIVDDVIRYIKLVCRGADAELYELSIFSNDYDMSFGQKSEANFGNIDYLQEDNIVEIPVYNESDYMRSVHLGIESDPNGLYKHVLMSTTSSGEYTPCYRSILDRFNLKNGYFNRTTFDGGIELDKSWLFSWNISDEDLYKCTVYDNNTRIVNKTAESHTYEMPFTISSGKWHFEFYLTNSLNLGIASDQADTSASTNLGHDSFGIALNTDTGNIYYNGSYITYFDAAISGKRVGMFIDVDNSELYFTQGNTWGAVISFSISGSLTIMSSLAPNGDITIYSPMTNSFTHPIVGATINDYDLIDNLSLTGYYISPMICLENNNQMASLDVIKQVSEMSNIDVYIDSSDQMPEPYYDVVFTYTDGRLGRYDLIKDNFYSISTGYNTVEENELVVNNKGQIYLFHGGTVRVYNRDLEYIYGSGDKGFYSNFGADMSGDDTTVWMYDRTTEIFQAAIVSSTTAEALYNMDTPISSITDFMQSFSTNKMSGTSEVWFADKGERLVICMDSTGLEIVKVVINNVYQLCAGENFCWLILDNYDEWYTVKVGIDFSLSEQIYLSSDTPTATAYDPVSGGFYFACSSKVYHFNGKSTRYIGNYFTVTYMEYIPDMNCLLISNKLSSAVHIINASTGKIVKNISNASGAADRSEAKVLYKVVKTGDFPRSDDDRWSIDSKRNWELIPNDLFELGHYKYHQLKFVFNLKNYSDVCKVSSVMANFRKSITMNSNSQSNFFIKLSELSNLAGGRSYEAPLRVYWEDVYE